MRQKELTRRGAALLADIKLVGRRLDAIEPRLVFDLLARAVHTERFGRYTTKLCPLLGNPRYGDTTASLRRAGRLPRHRNHPRRPRPRRPNRRAVCKRRTTRRKPRVQACQRDL